MTQLLTSPQELYREINSIIISGKPRAIENFRGFKLDVEYTGGKNCAVDIHEQVSHGADAHLFSIETDLEKSPYSTLYEMTPEARTGRRVRKQISDEVVRYNKTFPKYEVLSLVRQTVEKILEEQSGVKS